MKIHIQSANGSILGHDDTTGELMEHSNATIKVNSKVSGEKIKTHMVSPGHGRQD